jgi:dienelactone hydrolase
VNGYQVTPMARIVHDRKHRLSLAYVVACLWLIGAHASASEQEFRILSPSGSNLHPVVLFVPGCSGFAAISGVSHYEERAVELQAAGYAVVFVDYVGRRMQTNCAHISQSEIAQDISDAAAWAKGQPDVDVNRMSVIGWSYGGGGVFAALKAMPPDPLIAKAVMYCPVCRGAVPWTSAVDGLMLLGEKDDVAYPTLCKPVVDGVPATRLRVVTYPDARHGFDNRGFPEHVDQSGAPVYNAEAAKASWAAVLEFLK